MSIVPNTVLSNTVLKAHRTSINKAIETYWIAPTSGLTEIDALLDTPNLTTNMVVEFFHPTVSTVGGWEHRKVVVPIDLLPSGATEKEYYSTNCINLERKSTGQCTVIDEKTPAESVNLLLNVWGANNDTEFIRRASTIVRKAGLVLIRETGTPMNANIPRDLVLFLSIIEANTPTLTPRLSSQIELETTFKQYGFTPMTPRWIDEASYYQVFRRDKIELTRERVDPKWQSDLQKFLYRTLAPIIQDKINDKPVVMRYLDAPAMEIWVLAFTHETWNPKHNYEQLEYLGDAVVKLLFPYWLMNKFPTLNKAEYTNLNNAYMSKSTGFQANVAQQLHLGQYTRLRSISGTQFNINTDLFESFFGAIFTIGNTILPGRGYIDANNVLNTLMSNVNIDMEEAKGNSITQIEQLFSRFNKDLIGKPLETTEKEEGLVTITVTLTLPILLLLSEYGIIISDPVIGSGSAPTKAPARNKAFQQALETLKSYGVTTRWAEMAKNARDFLDPHIAQYIPQLRKKTEESGYIRYQFFTPHKTQNNKGAIVQLIGINRNDDQVVLASTYSVNPVASRVDLIRMYLGIE